MREVINHLLNTLLNRYCKKCISNDDRVLKGNCFYHTTENEYRLRTQCNCKGKLHDICK